MARETINCVVMFADVAGSTSMYENMGDDLARERISDALDSLISISGEYGGKLVKTIGDEILVYFTDADEAVNAARRIQETMEDDGTPETIGVSIRIGMQYGSTILEDDDIFGDTVNVAARIVSMAKARQILCTQEIAFMLKNADLASTMRPYDRLRVKGRNEQLDVYLVAWEQDGEITNIASTSNFNNPSRYDQTTRLVLRYDGDSRTLSPDTETFVMGRGKDCEMVIRGDLISRHHSRIEHRRGKFVIADQSTNGTFLRTSEGQDIYLRREEFALFGSGVISLGRKVDLNDENLIHFMCE